MAQIAQQDHLVIDCGTSFLGPTDEAKGKLRKAYLRGTLLDCVLEIKTVESTSKTKILGYSKFNDNHILVNFADVTEFMLTYVDCGELQPEDYSDDVPYDGE